VTGTLEDYLPAGSGNPMELNVGDGASPMDVVRRLRLSTNDRYLIAVNGNVVPQSEQASRPLAEDDIVSIMPPLKGG
ncbi:MoaD/ThiS family protein, partial [Pseudomonadota bacterium]